MKVKIVSTVMAILAMAQLAMCESGQAVYFYYEREAPKCKYSTDAVTVSSTGVQLFIGTNCYVNWLTVNSTHPGMSIGFSTAAQTSGGLPVYIASMSVNAWYQCVQSSSTDNIFTYTPSWFCPIYNASDKTLGWQGGLSGSLFPSQVTVWAFMGDGRTDTFSLDTYAIGYKTYGSTVSSRAK